MSGIEVAGLVLACFPIVVRGMQSFPESVETVKSWRRYRRELRKYSRTLETQRIVFFNTIERLFDGIIGSGNDLEALMQDPRGALSHGRYDEALKRRLDRSYDNFVSIMTAMLQPLSDLRKELGIDDHGKACGDRSYPHAIFTDNIQILWDNYSSGQRQVKKIKLVVSGNIYKEILGQVKESNRELREFTQDSHILEPARSKRRSKREEVDFKAIRRHARSLFNVVVTGSCWKCRCRNYHTVSLRLEPRPVSMTFIWPDGSTFAILREASLTLRLFSGRKTQTIGE